MHAKKKKIAFCPAFLGVFNGSFLTFCNRNFLPDLGIALYFGLCTGLSFSGSKQERSPFPIFAALSSHLHGGEKAASGRKGALPSVWNVIRGDSKECRNSWSQFQICSLTPSLYSFTESIVSWNHSCNHPPSKQTKRHDKMKASRPAPSHKRHWDCR